MKSTTPSTPAHHPVVIATLWMTGALLSFMIMALGGRELAGKMSIFEILFFRSGVGLPIIVVLLWLTGWGQISLANLKLHFARNIAHFCGQYGWFYAVGVIPLAQVFAIEFTQPIWVAVIATLMLGERMTRARVTAIVLGIIGVLLILRPGLAAINPGSLAVLGAAFLFSFAIVFTRKLAQRESALAILFYMSMIQLPLVLGPTLANWVTPTAAMWPWALLVGITGMSAHYCMARAITLVDATVVAPMDFLRVPLIAQVGYVYYGEAFDWFVLIGAAIMLAGNFINIRAERARVPRP